MKFSEFQAGQVLQAGPFHLSEAEVLSFAHRYDPQWFHNDPQAAAAGRFGGLIASGWQSCGIAMRLAATFLQGSETFASPGIAYIRFPLPVRPGDELRLSATVLEVRRSEKKPDLGILRWRWQLFNHSDAEVLDLEVTSLFDLSGAST
jgi:acyl dehydratase